MENYNIEEEMFLTYGSISQEQVNKLVFELRSAGMKPEDIQKVGEHANLFTINPKMVKKPATSIKKK